MGGFLRIGRTAEQQALHDRIAQTLVVRRDASPADVRQGGGVMAIESTGGIALAAGLVVMFLVPAVAVQRLGALLHGDAVRRSRPRPTRRTRPGPRSSG
jgi:hypothetical protein